MLLLQPGLGEGVLQRLEEAGYASIELLQAHDVRLVIEQVSAQGTQGALHNRSRALQRAIAAWRQPAAAALPERACARERTEVFAASGAAQPY